MSEQSLPPGMARFEHVIYEQDRIEGLRIDELFDEKEAEGWSSAGALGHALETAETEFTKDYWDIMPGVKEFGYGIAKNAWRWLSYIAAYTDEIEQAGEEHPDAKRIPGYHNEKGLLNDALFEEYPSSVHFRMLDLLERTRLRRVLDNEPAVDPFLLGQEHSALLLTQTIEEVFKYPDQVKFRDTSGRLKFMDGKAHYMVEKPEPKGHRRKPVYVIDKEVAVGTQGRHQTAAVYLIDGVIDFQDRASVMNSRGGQPWVEAGTILDITYALTWNNPHFADAALEQTEAILETRRAAADLRL